MSVIIEGPMRTGLFLHIPKTGGVWLYEVMKELVGESKFHLVESRCGNQFHPLLSDIKDGYDLSYSVVRHPVTWYESWWAFQAGSWVENSKREGWWAIAPTEACASDDFNTFVRRMLCWQPGFVSRMYEWFLGPPGKTNVHIVGRFEELYESTACFSNALGIEKGEDYFAGLGKRNVSLKRAGKPVWDPELRERVVAAEMPAICRFYGGYDEHNRFVGRQ